MSSLLDPGRFPQEIRPLATKVLAGDRLDEHDALVALTTPHVLWIGKLANHVRQRMHGDVTFYNVIGISTRPTSASIPITANSARLQPCPTKTMPGR